MTSIIRSPDGNFANLPEFGFAPNYAKIPDSEFGTLRMHYLDEGSRDGPVILLMHGQGCWSYIFRRMIPILVGGGLRVVAPDFIGFGRSDKLPGTEDYTFEKHVGWLKSFLDLMAFEGISAYFFDWGGYFGLRIAADRPEIFERIALSNTQLPVGDAPGREWFINWRAEQFALPKFPQGEMVDDGTFSKLTPDTIAAFDAPYPDESYKTGPRRFPMILPISPDMASVPENRAAWEKLKAWRKPVLTLFSAGFRGTAMGPEKILAHIPGADDQDHALLDEANFYIVEDRPVELSSRLLAFVRGALS
ncbi:MAG: haloalkane dehalogenase [Gammaproteobacteria bacterium]